MPIEVYGTNFSAPVRNVMMTCEALGLEYEFKHIDMAKGEHKTPEYVKMNPQHNIPTLKDGDFCLNESRAISAYLVDAYGKKDDHPLNPKDPKVRARVNQYLYFDMGVLYKACGECVYPIMFAGAKEIAADKMTRLEEVLGWVQDWVAKTGYAAGTTSMTLADISWTSSLSTLEAAGIIDLEKKFPGVHQYLAKMKKEVPNYEKANGEGSVAFGNWFKSKQASA